MGLRVFFYREENNSRFVPRCVKKETAGGVVNAGFECKVWKGLLVDLFVDYHFKKLHFDCYVPYSNNTVNNDNARPYCCPSCVFDIHLGGVVAGIGIGYEF